MVDLNREEAEKELKELLLKLDDRKKNFKILDVDIINGTNWRKPIQKQVELFKDFQNRLNVELGKRLRYLLYYGGNGAGKTFIGAYVVALLALWHDWKKYSLPFIWSKKSIWIATKSGNNVKTTIDRYLLGNWSPCRIPQCEIETINRDNKILKSIYLKNGCIIYINTYDQGAENLQGWEPDFLWMDEEPVDEDVWTELRFRTRDEACETLITMTPLSGLTPVYEYFFEQSDEDVRSKSKVYHVSSMDNPHTDKTLTKGLNEETYRLRVEGSFENPTWLVYNEFFRSRNTILHFDPRLMSISWWDVRYYRGVDFWTSHPTAVVFLAQDEDDNFYVWDEIKESDMLLSDIVERINKKSVWFHFEYTIRDSAAKREGMELQKLGIRTVPADKHSKGANDMSNRRTWILLLNEMMSKWKLLISSNCTKLIRELETHYYKEGGKKDGEVNKENDDLLDALRYVIFMVKKNNWVNKKSQVVRQVEKKYSSNSNKLRGF